LAACGSAGNSTCGAPDKTLNVYNWSGYIAPDTVANFEREIGIVVHYSTVPREGAVAGLDMLDMLAIPADAPHSDNAHKWLNYLMRPEVMADISNVLKYRNGNKASLPFVQEAIKNDPATYPDAKTRANLSIETMQPPELKRLMTRLWTRFREAALNLRIPVRRP
jgi:putrescine transport system substrate-binding protein